MAALPTRGLVGRFLGTTIATGAGFAWGRAAGPVLSPPLQALRNEVNERYPFVPLTPQQATQAEIVGAMTAAEARAEAKRSGVNESRANALRAIAGQAPGFAQLVSLRNRDLITDVQFERGLGQLGIRDEWRDDVRALRWQLPSGAELAEMAVQGVLEYDQAQELAIATGTQATTFERYYRLAGDPIAGDELLALWNRGAISEADVDRGLRQSKLKPEWVARFKELRHVLAPVSDLVRFAVREVYNPEQRAALNLDAEFPPAFATQAARVGLDETTARAYWAAHWDLPSYSQATEMLFRGEISQGEFEGLLKALDYAPTWRGKLAAIARRIPTISDMIRFAQREVYSPAQRRELGLDADYPDEFTAQAAKHGMSEQDARDYWAAHWRLPSALQGYRMLWRGEIDAGELDGLLKALDYPAKWRDRLANIAYLQPGRIDLRRMLTAGLKTPAEVEADYRKLGYTPADAKLMLQLAQATGSSAAKDLTLAQLTAEYSGHFIDRAEYERQLAELGYSPLEVQQLGDLADAKRVSRARDQLVNRIHSQYVGHKVDRATAIAALGEANVGAKARELMFAEWDNERAVNVRTLTQAQIVKAYKKSLIPREVALDELTDQGLADADANTLLDSA